MARTPIEGSGQGPHDHQPTVLAVNDAGSVSLPNGIDATALDMARDGQDLVLTSPDGQVFIIEGYFLMPDAPLILSADGAMLSPGLVQSFLNDLNDIEVAAGNQLANDASAVGEVTEVSGNGTVTHADGTKEKITAGTKIFEGDIIETDAVGAVNIQFADESTFAVSQNARLAVDDFSFNPDDQSGSTGLSILRGVFMFTSGLVGRENPDAVQIETPVGSIGIRGTIIGGEISANGRTQISVIEGAIVVRNGNGEKILSTQFETVTLTGFNAPITNIGTLNAGQMTKSYGAVRPVAPTLFTSIDDTSRDNNQPQQQQNQPQSQGEQQQQQNPQQNQAPEAPQTEVLPPALNDHPIFQELNTGSQLDSPLGAPPAHASHANPPVSVTVTVTPPTGPVASPPPQVVDIDIVIQDHLPLPPAPALPDTRPPAELAISNNAVNEDSTAGAVVGDVSQTESRSYAVVYSLQSNPGNIFAIDPNTGRVTVATQAGDVDAGTLFHDIVVRVTRPDTGQFEETTIRINLTPVDETPVFGTSGTNVNEGAAVLLTPSMLGASDPEHQESGLVYTVKETNHGVLERFDGSAWVVLNVGDTFSQADLLGNDVKFLHDGSEPGSNVANFKITATDTGGNESAEQTVPVTVAPQNDAMTQTTDNEGHVTEHGTTAINGAKLVWSDVDNAPSEIVYTIQSQSHGSVEKFNGSTWVALSVGGTFTQADVNAGNKLRFVHNGDESATYTTAGFTYDVTDGTATSTANNMSFTVDAYNDAPVLVDNNTDTVTEDDSVILSNTTLDYSDADNPHDEIVYEVTDETGGQIEYSADGVTGWTPVASFTQQDIDDGKVRFHHDGNSNATAEFKFEVTDGEATLAEATHNFNVTAVNDEPTSVSIATGFTLAERDGGATPDDISTVAIVDEDGNYNPTDHDMIVERKVGGTWTTDSRFEVVDTGSGWKLQATNSATFDYEDGSNMLLRVKLTDGSHTRYSGELTLTITDVDEIATVFDLDPGIPAVVGGTSYDALLQGRMGGAHVGALLSDDGDLNPAFRYDASHYYIEVASGGGLTANDFEIVEILDEQNRPENVLKLKNGVSPDFSTGQTITVTVRLDEEKDGQDATDLTQTFTIRGRNDMMSLESVNGKNGFMIENDSRFPGTSNGVRFGASVAAGDLDGDGKKDLVFGAPLAQNGAGNGQETGGVYVFRNTGSALVSDASDNGTIALSDITQGSPTLPGFFHELPDGNDGNRYGARIAVLTNFDGRNSAGGEIAITNPGAGSVEVRNAGSLITTITNIPNGSVTGDALADAINVAAIGDINGDGLADLLVTAKLATSGQGQAGIVFGSNSLPATIDFTSLTGTTLAPTATNDAHFGAQATALGDLNGDGFDDFAVSAPNMDTDGAGSLSGQGQVFVYFGGASATGTNLTANAFIISGNETNQHLGSSLANAGDFNRDGLSDLLIRSESTDAGRGSVSLVYGNANLAGHAPVNMSDLNNGGSFPNFDGFKLHWNITDTAIKVGDSMGSAGDFNGDGYGDIFLDVTRDLGAGSFEHTLFVVYGNNSGSTATLNLDTMLNGTLADQNKAFKIRLSQSDSSHLSVANAGDINGDGYDDLVIGDPSVSQDSANSQDGGAYVVYGNNYNANTDTIAVVGSSVVNAASNNQAFIGDNGNNEVFNNSVSLVTFNGGMGDDTFKINNATNIHFDGGLGMDTLKLFYSSGETTGTAGTDSIPLGSHFGDRMTGVEVIAFDMGSYKDVLTLDARDVLSMLETSDTHTLTIKALQDLSGNVALKNSLTITNLAALGFTKDDNSDTTQDRADLWGTGDAYKYTHQATGYQLIVDSRITNAETLIP